jgi:hypothetical protein
MHDGCGCMVTGWQCGGVYICVFVGLCAGVFVCMLAFVCALVLGVFGGSGQGLRAICMSACRAWIFSCGLYP